MFWRKFAVAGFLIGALSLAIFAQDIAAEDTQNPKTTRLVDEFGKVTDCDLSARVDNFFIQLNNAPEAVGYVILYKGVDWLPADLESNPIRSRITRNIAFRKYDGSRLVFVDGGFRESFSTELFLVPPGGEPPQPSNTIPVPAKPKGTFQWGRSWLGTEENFDDLRAFVLPSVIAEEEESQRQQELEEEIEAAANGTLVDVDKPQAAEATAEETSTEEAEPKLSPEEIDDLRFSWANERFAEEVARRKGSHGIIIFYADDQYYDITKLLHFVETGRDRIASAAKLPPSKIRVIYGGYGYCQIEYHIVSKGSPDPQPKPKERDSAEQN